jgi:hypothetical protein
MSSATTLLFGLFTISGCYSPERLSVQTMVPYPPFPDSVMVVLLGKADVRHIDGQKIGSVYYDQGDEHYPLTGFRMADSLRRTALQHGANLVKITHELLPTRRYMFEKLSADLYRVTDARYYTDEEVIEWSGDRKLSFADFKYHGRIYSDTSVLLSNGSYDFGIVSTFHCEHSWINRASKDSAEALLHEQGNFDLCEIYCRQFLTRIREGKSWTSEFWAVVRTTWKEKRVQYESETAGGLDYRRQVEWTEKIHHALVFGTDTSNAEFRLK